MRIISFDLDGTLITDEFSQTIWHHGLPELYAMQYQCDLASAQELILDEYNKVGDEKMEWYDIHHWFNRFKLDADWRKLFANFTHCIRTYPEVHEVLDYLQHHYMLIITSNAAREFLDTEIEYSGIANYFSRIISATSDLHRVKNDMAFYRDLCHLLEIRCSDLIHVGDHYRFDYLVPTEVGIRSFYLDRNNRCTDSKPFIINNLNDFLSRVSG